MKDKFYSLCIVVVLFVSVMIIVGCNKNDNNNPQEPAQVQIYHMVVNATKGEDNKANGPKRVLGLDGATLNATWATGEEVTVYNETKQTTISGVLTAQSDGTSTTLEGELAGIIEPSDVLTLKFLSPNYTEQKGTIEYISANCDYAEASVTVASVSSGNITPTTDAVFENKQAIVKFTLIDKAEGTTLLKPATLTINDGTSDIATLTDIPASTYTTNGDGVLYVAIPGFADKTLTLTATIGTKTYSYEKEHATFMNGQYYAITMKMEKDLPQGALSGEFSINATKKIRFAKGNLQYQASTHTWKFAENQWIYSGNNNDLISSSYSGWIDLFGWGTGNNPLKTSTDNSLYSSFVDWGSNAISNGGNQANMWRTLSKDEWTYILSGRINASSKCGLGRVNGVNGFILFPNTWTLPSGLSFQASAKNYTTNSYSLENWLKMEEKGAIFLPAAGRRGANDHYWGEAGFYWSSTKSYSTQSYCLLFYSNFYELDEYNVRYSGYSVRLVQDVE